MLGWTDEKQTLFNTPTKDLDPVDKLEKKKLQQSINSTISDMKDQLKKEQTETKSKEKRSPLEIFMSDIEKASKRLQNDEMFTHQDQVIIAMEELYNTIERSS